MTVKLGIIEFGGQRGQILKPCAEVEYYTRFGDNKIRVQKINVSAMPSRITLWVVKDTFAEVDNHVTAVLSQVGIRTTFTDTHGEVYNSAYLIERPQYSIVKKASDKWILTYDMTIVTDNRESEAEEPAPEFPEFPDFP